MRNFLLLCLYATMLHIESKYDLPGITELKIPENVSLTF